MAGDDRVYKNFSADEMEAQYNPRLGRPDYEVTVMPDWFDRSERARADLEGRLDIAYGPSERQKIDLFTAERGAAPTLVYFHGGYWQRGEKAMYSFLAEPFVSHGVNVAIVGYDLCPAVTITEISMQARDAIAWMWRQAENLAIDRDRITVMGHSAGGHITGMMMGTDWPAIGGDLPGDLIKAGIPISPLNDLQPLLFTSINGGVRMDEAEAEAQSPMNNPPATNAPQLMVTGQSEPEEFQHQADLYVDAFATASRPIERYIVPGCDHFDEINALARDGSPFFQKALALILARKR